MRKNYSFFIKAGSVVSALGLFSNFSASAILNDFKKFFCDEILDYFYTMKAVSKGENFFKENEIKDQLDIEKYILCSVIDRSLNLDYFLAILNILPEESNFKINNKEDFCNYVRIILGSEINTKRIDDKKFKEAEQEIEKTNKINVRTEFLNFFNKKNQYNFYYENSSFFGIKEKLGSIYYLLGKNVPLKIEDLANFDKSVFKNIFEKFLEIKEKIFTKTSKEILDVIKIDENERRMIKDSINYLEKDIKEKIEFYYKNEDVNIKNFKEDFFKILEKFKSAVLLVGDKIRNHYSEILGVEEKTKKEEVFHYEKYVTTLSKILNEFPELKGKLEFENKYNAVFSLKVPEYKGVESLNIVDLIFEAKTHLQRSKINEELMFKIKNSIKELKDKYNNLVNVEKKFSIGTEFVTVK